MFALFCLGWLVQFTCTGAEKCSTVQESAGQCTFGFVLRWDALVNRIWRCEPSAAGAGGSGRLYYICVCCAPVILYCLFSVLVLLMSCVFSLLQDLKAYLLQKREEPEAFLQSGTPLQFACGIASGLDHMHKNNFVHV